MVEQVLAVESTGERLALGTLCVRRCTCGTLPIGLPSPVVAVVVGLVVVTPSTADVGTVDVDAGGESLQAETVVILCCSCAGDTRYPPIATRTRNKL